MPGLERDTMGFDFGLDEPNTCFKRKFRWLLRIPDVCSDTIQTLPPLKGSRPSLSFKEMEVQHTTETIYFPGKPEWKPITLTLYDIKKNQHPVFEWIKKLYDPDLGEYKYSFDDNIKESFKKSEAELAVYDGCGNIIETWIYENIWCQNIEFGDLDMTSSEYLTCDITLRYDRAYIR